MALKQIEIPGVQVMRQGEHELYVAVMDATSLLEIAEVLRFGEHPLGVNRELIMNRVKEIGAFMRQRNGAIMRDPIQGCLYAGDGQEWRYDEKRRLLVGEVETDPEKRLDGCFLAIDDGQHRFAALEFLTGDERQGWNFTVIMGKNMDVEDRIALFMQGEKRVRVSRRLLLQQMDATNRFPNPATRGAYRAARILNEASGSPLKGRIYFGENPRVPKGHIAITSLMGQLKYLMGRRSRLHPYGSDDQGRALLHLFMATAQQWPTLWGRDDKTLGRKLGYLTLMTLLARSGNLHSLLQGDFSLDSMKRAIVYTRGFRHWDHTGTKDGSITYNKLAQMLDDHIGQQITSEQVARNTC